MKSLKFKSDDEKHAWDMYAAGAASCPDAPASESAEYGLLSLAYAPVRARVC